MANVGIVSDSNIDLPEEVIKDLDIGIVPGRIIFSGDEVRRHYVDITYEEFYHRLVHDKATPSTSVPSPKEYHQAFEEGLKKYDELIVFCTSAKLSSMVNIAQLVVKDYFSDKVTVIDSQKISLPFGIIVLKIALKAREGASKDELLSYFEDLSDRTHAFGGIPTLTYLQKGGRIGKAASLMGNLMQVKPIISIENGELTSLGKVRGMDNVYSLLYDFCKLSFEKETPEHFVIGHTANLATAEKLAEELKLLPNAPEKIQIIEFGPSVGTHLGPGGLFISWIGEFDKELLAL